MVTSQLAEQEALNEPSLEKAGPLYSASLRTSTGSSASMRMVAAPHGLAAGPMAVFESVGIDADFFPEAADAQYLSSISETLWPGTVGVFRPRCGRITRKPRSVAPMGTQHHLQYVTEQIASLSLFKAVPNQRLQLIQVIRD
jgi:hypothetical protein